MKKLFLLPFLAFLPLLAHAFTGQVEIDGINYFIKTAGNAAEVRAKSGGYSGDIVIPPTVVYDGVTCNVILIAAGAFQDCTSLTSVTIGNSVTSIEWNAFSNCTSLTSVTIGNSVTSIGSSAFKGCTSLTSITIPNSVTSIGKDAFQGCTSLTSVTIGNSVTSIGAGAFQDCSSLTSVTIPNSVTSIGYGVFSGCTSLTSVTIGNSVTSINDCAFYNCTSLTSVTIPNSVTWIGEYAFYNCTSLTSVTIPNSVTSIGKDAFQGCTSLTSVTIPNSVTSIGWDAFSGCTSLTSVTIGSGIKEIGYSAFANCPDLADVYCLAVNVPGTKSDAFIGSYPQYATLHVPDESVDKYKNKSPWSEFGTIVGLSGGGGSGESNKCAKPTIGYINNRLTFSCETAGATCQYSITDDDVRAGSGSELQLTVTYHISAYATKSGMLDSDVATATLCWIDKEADFSTDISPAAELKATPVLIQSAGGTLTIQGAAEGTPISVFTTAGMQAGSTVSRAGLATLNTTLQPGSIAIVRIGEKSVKVLVE